MDMTERLHNSNNNEASTDKAKQRGSNSCLVRMKGKVLDWVNMEIPLQEPRLMMALHSHQCQW